MKLNHLIEMALPRNSDINKIYYHGTLSSESATNIYKNGLDPEFTVVKYGTKKSALRPQDDNVYITSDLSYAIIYGIGGDLAGSNHIIKSDIEKYGEFGFVFEIDGKELADIGPDEDDIGKLIYYAFEDKSTNPILKMLMFKAETELTVGQLKKLKDADFNTFAIAGKKISKVLSNEQKLAVIDLGTHIAHKGKVKTSKCWRFSRYDVKHFKKDGSNFFDYATEFTWR